MKFLAVYAVCALVLGLQGPPGSHAQTHPVCQKSTCNKNDLQLFCLTGGTIAYGECGLQEAICSPEAVDMGITIDTSSKCLDCTQFPNRPWC